jgi:NAD(P)-dependent dehydrogenase (short-subunit alcohol dehydrogenase family)
MKTLLVTGVSSGLGKAIIESQSKEFQILGISRKPSSEIIFSYEDIAKFPEFQVVVLNAAMGDSGSDFFSIDETEFTEIIMSNLVKPIMFIKELNRNNRLANLKSLIIIGSRFSSMSYISNQSQADLPGYGYCISKAALAIFTQIIRKESLPFTVNIIHPGVLNSQMGNDSGLDVNEVAKKLLSDIQNDVFSKQMDGIYDLNTGGIIPF